MRTVIVDDEPFARMRLAKLCEQHAELEVVAQAGSGSEALDVIRAHQPELLMLDVELPDMSGFEVLRLLEPGPQPVAIVVAAHPHYAVSAGQLAAGRVHREDERGRVCLYASQRQARHLRRVIP